MNSTARRFTVFALTAGPVVTLAGMAATPWEKVATTVSYHEALAGSPTQAQIAAVLLMFGYALMGPAWGTVLFLSRDRAPKALLIAAATLAFFGATFLPGFVISDFYDLALAQTLPAADAVRASDAAQGFAIGAVPMAFGVGGMLLGSVLVAFAGWRGGVAGPWLPALVMGSYLVTFPFVERPDVIVGASAIVVIAYALVARRVVSTDRDRPATPSTSREISEVVGAPPEPYDPQPWRAGSSSSAASTSETATASRCPACVKS